MHITNSVAILAGLAASTTARYTARQTTAASFDASTASIDELAAYALSTANARIASSGGSCTSETVIVRKLFENLTDDERIAYTSALNCLMELPAKTPSDLAPGAKTRYDDFVATHINQTLSIHSTANFLGWHRWFVWEMEQSLRNECGYTGSIPYWDWSKTASEGFSASAMFDGSATSLSGNGQPVERSAGDYIILAAGTDAEVVLPMGTGGGCVVDGPFANMTVNLGPDGLTLANDTTDSSAAWYAYNPRCLKRDFTDEALQRFANETSVLTLVRDQPDVWEFETLLQGLPNRPEIGAHGGGHYAMGGDPGRDIFVSPGEPLFWSHHAQVDRVWWMWQMLDPETRAGNVSTAIRGALTFTTTYDGEGNGTLTDLQNLGYVKEGVEVELGALLDNGAGMFCTVYE